MSQRNQLAAAALILVGVLPLGAQGRTVNLTGRPQAELDEPFTSISGLHEVAPGKVVLADMQEQRLILADLNANTFKNIGSKGGGPGEWQFAMGVSPGLSGTAYVSDPNLRRMHVVDATGKIASSVPFPGGEVEDGPNVVRMTIPRGTDAQGRIFFTGPPFTPGVQTQPDSVPIIRWDPRTKKTDSLGMLKNETKVTQSSSGGNNRVMARVGGGPYSPQTVWLPLPNGRAAVVNPSPYRVDIHDAGQVRRGVAAPFTPVRIGKAERDAYRNRSPGRPMSITMGGAGGGGMRIASGGAMPDAPPIPDADFPAVMPPFSGGGIIVAPNSEIWVLRNRPAADPTPTYDIWSPAGQLIGKATLRPHSAVIGFGQGSVYVSRQDPEDDLRYIEKYPLQ